MKLLVLSQWFPYPPNNGSRLRVYNLLKELSSKHSLRLITFRQDAENPEHVAALREICEHVETVQARQFNPSGMNELLGLLSPRPRSSVARWSLQMSTLVRRELQMNTPDAIIALTLLCAEYVAAVTSLPKILDLENADAAYIKRLAQAQSGWLSKFRLKLTWVKLVRYESRLAGRFDAVLTVSEEDRAELMRTASDLAKRHAAYVVPNGVDLSLLDYTGPQKKPFRIISTGALTYIANYDASVRFCREILPKVRKRIPQAEYVVTGDYNGVDVSPLIEAGAVLTGLVSDIRPEVAQSTVLAVPLRFGGGTRLKILEAMALGTPVVSSTVGAMGIGAEDGEHLMLADDPECFADATCDVLQDPVLAARLSSKAREHVAGNFGWDLIASRLDDILRETADRVGDKNA